MVLLKKKKKGGGGGLTNASRPILMATLHENRVSDSTFSQWSGF